MRPPLRVEFTRMPPPPPAPQASEPAASVSTAAAAVATAAAALPRPGTDHHVRKRLNRNAQRAI